MACDPSFSKVVLLLHLDGANGSSTFTDSSIVNNTVSQNGSAVLETATPKFGSAALDTIGGANVNFISAPITAGAPLDILDQSGGDFTIEGWFYVPTPTGTGLTAPLACISKSDGTNEFLVYVTPDASAFAVQTSISSWAGAGATSGVTVTYSAWHHFAAVRYGGFGALYLDGTLIGVNNNAWSASYTSPSGNQYTIGYQPGLLGSNLPMYVDEVRVTKGLARYTANFTPPTLVFGGACGSKFWWVWET